MQSVMLTLSDRYISMRSIGRFSCWAHKMGGLTVSVYIVYTTVH